jgi:hypothetical protein
VLSSLSNRIRQFTPWDFAPPPISTRAPFSSFPQSQKDRSVEEVVKRRSRAAHCVASVVPCHNGRFRLEVTYLISFASRAFAGAAEASKRMEWLLTRRKEMQPPCLLRSFISGRRSGPTGQPIGNITSLPGQVKCRYCRARRYLYVASVFRSRKRSILAGREKIAGCSDLAHHRPPFFY